jgi:hypothetical protein
MSASRRPRSISNLANQPREHVLDPLGVPEDSFDICRTARAESSGDFHGCCSLAAFTERDGVDTALVSSTAATCSFSGIQSARRSALSSLLPQVSVTDRGAGNEPDQFEGQRVSLELVMGQRGEGIGCPDEPATDPDLGSGIATDCEFVLFGALQAASSQPHYTNAETASGPGRNSNQEWDRHAAPTAPSNLQTTQPRMRLMIRPGT